MKEKYNEKDCVEVCMAVLPDEEIVSVENSDTKEYKCIPDARLARRLLKLGNVVVDIKPLKKEHIDTDKKPSNFVFELTDKLIADYKEITGYDLRL